MIRLEERPFELEGKTYLLRCNMAVLESVERLHGGDFEAVLNTSVRQSAVEFLAAMLNDYAEEQGWECRWTAEALKRKVSVAMLKALDITGMVTRAMDPGAAQAAQADGNLGN